MTNTVVVDANIVIRFLLNDEPKLSLITKTLFSKAQNKKITIYLDEVILAEVIWTLSSFYKIKRSVLSDKMEKLISQDWIVNPKKELMFKAIYFYQSSSLDYIDCWIYVVSKTLNFPLETFDKKLQRFDK